MVYLSHYSLKENPFQDIANPKYFWIGDGQSEALATLKFGIDNGGGTILLTGDIGIGKTVLVKYFTAPLKEKFKIVKINDSDIDTRDFMLFLADSFKLPYRFKNKSSFFWYMDEQYSKTKKKMLIVMDEAHRLSKKLFNDLNLMAKIKRNDEQLINIVLVGQKPLIELAKKVKLNSHKQKDSIVCHLRPLTKKEMFEYIKHRIEIAGAERNLFSCGAIGKIFQYSGGIPRVINTICDHALMVGYSTDSKKIKTSVIKECAEDLQISTKGFRQWEGFSQKNHKAILKNSKQKLLN